MTTMVPTCCVATEVTHRVVVGSNVLVRSACINLVDFEVIIPGSWPTQDLFCDVLGRSKPLGTLDCLHRLSI